MQIKKLNECMEMLDKELGKSIQIADIWSVKEGMSIAGLHSKPGIAERGNIFLSIISKMLADMGAPPLGKYMLTDLPQNNKVAIVPMNDYCAAMIISGDVQLGYFLHVLLPNFIDKFEEAVVT